jgi:hypothetical protein
MPEDRLSIFHINRDTTVNCDNRGIGFNVMLDSEVYPLTVRHEKE